MKVRQLIIKIYIDPNGKVPFEQWFSNLSAQAKIKVQVRLDRAESGNFGDFKSIKNGVYELRIHALSGLRIYFGLDEEQIILLLCGGIKKTQSNDIKRAKEFWQDYLYRKNKNVH